MLKWMRKLFCPLIAGFCPYCNELNIVKFQSAESKEQEKENKGDHANDM